MNDSEWKEADALVSVLSELHTLEYIRIGEENIQVFRSYVYINPHSMGGGGGDQIDHATPNLEKVPVFAQ